jgi:hypothetical protein
VRASASARVHAWVALLVLLAGAAQARTLIVDGACPTSGSGETPTCGASGPLRTVQEGIQAMQPGDTVHIRGAHDGFDGVYVEALELAGAAAKTCTAAAPCVIQGCRAGVCPKDETPRLRGMRRHDDWTEPRPGVFRRVMEAVEPGEQRDEFDPGMLMQDGKPLAYDGDAVAAPRDGHWSYDPATHAITVNPVGKARAQGIEVPAVPIGIHMAPPTAHVTLQHFSYEGTRWIIVEAGRPRKPSPGLVFADLTLRFAPRFFIHTHTTPGMRIERVVGEYGCRGISWLARHHGGCWGLRAFGANDATIRGNTMRHLGSAGGRRIGTNGPGWPCPWCDPPWNDGSHTDLSALGMAYEIKQTAGATLTGNLAEDTANVGCGLDVSRRVRVEGNRFVRTREGVTVRDFTPTSGCPTTNPERYCFNAEHVIERNTIEQSGNPKVKHSCAISVDVGRKARTTAPPGPLARIVNNTIIGARGGTICLPKPPPAGVVVEGNVVK